MDKCLMTKAKEECQCEDCKNYRKFRSIMLKQQTGEEIIKIYHQALEDAGVVPRKFNLLNEFKTEKYLKSKKLEGGLKNVSK